MYSILLRKMTSSIRHIAVAPVMASRMAVEWSRIIRLPIRPLGTLTRFLIPQYLNRFNTLITMILYLCCRPFVNFYVQLDLTKYYESSRISPLFRLCPHKIAAAPGQSPPQRRPSCGVAAGSLRGRCGIYPAIMPCHHRGIPS